MRASSVHSLRRVMTPWDVRTAARAAVFASVALVLALVVTALTDEGAVRLVVRVGRALPAAPVCGAVGTWLALRGARAKGEILALEGLGRSPLQNAIAAALGGAAIVLLAGLGVAAVEAVDVEGFYPRATRSEDYRFEAAGFVNARGGFRVSTQGDVERLPDGPPAAGAPAAATGIPTRGREAAALALSLAGLGLTLLAAQARRAHAARETLVDGAVLAATVALGIALFHAAAVGRAHALVASVPPALLLAWAVFRYRAQPWMKRSRS